MQYNALKILIFKVNVINREIKNLDRENKSKIDFFFLF